VVVEVEGISSAEEKSFLEGVLVEEVLEDLFIMD
jgi:hypothetical protein